MFCPYCGYEVSDEFRFCPKCGKSMPCAKPTPPKNDDANGGTIKPRGRYSRIGGDHCGGWNKTQCPSQELARQKVKWWKRFEIPEGMSAKKCAVRFLIGLVVCYVGWLMMSASTGYDAVQMRDSEYVSLYGQNGPTLLQWFVCLIGTAVNVCGIAYAYHAWSRLLDHVKYRPGLPSWAAKVVAVVVCAVAFALFSCILAVIKHPTHGERIMSVWDYLIIAAVCKAVWRFFVGGKVNPEVQKKESKKRQRKPMPLGVMLVIGSAIVIFFVWLLVMCASLKGYERDVDICETNVSQKRTDCIGEKDYSNASLDEINARIAEIDAQLARLSDLEEKALKKWDETEGKKYDLYQKALSGDFDADFSPIYAQVFDKKCGCYVLDTDGNGNVALDDRYATPKDVARLAYLKKIRESFPQ